jgi:predicted transposase YdaD
MDEPMTVSDNGRLSATRLQLPCTNMTSNDEALFEILGGRKAMIESPLLQELKKEWTEEGKREGKREGRREGEIESLRTVLIRRFGAQAEALETEITAIANDARLKDLIEHAATCRSLAAFRKKLTP